jgi:hypothetical protein
MTDLLKPVSHFFPDETLGTGLSWRGFRTVNSLKRAGITSKHTLSKMSDEELIGVRGIGQRSIEERNKPSLRWHWYRRSLGQ